MYILQIIVYVLVLIALLAATGFMGTHFALFVGSGEFGMMRRENKRGTLAFMGVFGTISLSFFGLVGYWGLKVNFYDWVPGFLHGTANQFETLLQVVS